MNRRALFVIAVALIGVLAELVVAVQLVHNRFVTNPVNANYVTLTVATVIAAIAVGVATARGAGWSGVGVLLVIGATGAAIGYTRFSSHPSEAAIGFVVANATALVPLHAGVSHREGVPSGIRRMLVGTHVLLALLADRDGDDRAGRVRSTAGSLPPIPSGSVATRWWSCTHPGSPGPPRPCGGSRSSARRCWRSAARYLRWRAAPRAARRSSAPVVAGSVAWTLMLGGAGIAMLLDRVGSAHAWSLSISARSRFPALALGVLAATIGWVELVRPRLSRVNARTIELRNGPTGRQRGVPCAARRCAPRRRMSIWRSPAKRVGSTAAAGRSRSTGTSAGRPS